MRACIRSAKPEILNEFQKPNTNRSPGGHDCSEDGPSALQVFDEQLLMGEHPRDPAPAEGDSRPGTANQHGLLPLHVANLIVEIVDLEAEMMQAAAVLEETADGRIFAEGFDQLETGPASRWELKVEGT